MSRLPKKTTKKVAMNQEKDFMKRQKEITKRANNKNKTLIKQLKVAANAKKYGIKMDSKTKRAIAAAKTKTVARSSAAASTAISTNVAGVEQARYGAEAAKYDALLTGNIYGKNAVDENKTGGDGNSNPKDKNQKDDKSDTGYYEGW